MNCLCIFVIALGVIYGSIGSMAHLGPHERGHFDTVKCCKVEKSTDQTEFIEQMMKIVDECKQELGPPEGGERHGRHICVHECLANRTNIINADKSINENEYRNFITNKMASQDYQKAAAEDIATKCIEELQKPEEEHPRGPNTSGCTMNAMRSFKCAARGMFKACPAEMQDTSERCTKIREMINSGKMRPHGEESIEGRDEDQMQIKML